MLLLNTYKQAADRRPYIPSASAPSDAKAENLDFCAVWEYNSIKQIMSLSGVLKGKHKMKKGNYTQWIYPAGLVLGIVLGEILQNVAIGVAIGAILGMIATFVVRCIKMPKDNE